MYWDIYNRNHPKYFFFSPFCNSDSEAHKLFKFYLNVFLELEGRLKSYGGPYLAPGPRVWCNALRSDGIKVIKRWWRRFLSTNRDDHHRYKLNRMNVRNNNCSSSAAVPPECFTFSASVGRFRCVKRCGRLPPRRAALKGHNRKWEIRIPLCGAAIELRLLDTFDLSRCHSGRFYLWAAEEIHSDPDLWTDKIFT